MLMVEGILILSCLIPAFHFADGTWSHILASGLFTFNVGLLLLVSFHRAKRPADKRTSYLLVVAMWVVLPLFGTLPFLSTGVLHTFPDALFESTSGITSTGATVFSAVEWLPSSILLWRSMTQWFGGFGIVLLVLAFVPSLGINKYSLYTAEASGADNTGKQASSMTTNLQQTLAIYLLLTAAFVTVLWKSGMHIWDAVNITFTNISSGGFSIYNNSLERLTSVQQYIVALAMIFSGINFAMLYNFFTFHWDICATNLSSSPSTFLSILLPPSLWCWRYVSIWALDGVIRCGAASCRPSVCSPPPAPLPPIPSTGGCPSPTSLWCSRSVAAWQAPPRAASRRCVC